jgi:hypothetical protein
MTLIDEGLEDEGKALVKAYNFVTQLISSGHATADQVKETLDETLVKLWESAEKVGESDFSKITGFLEKFKEVVKGTDLEPKVESFEAAHKPE